MKTGIEIVTGFLSSGKTSMINIILGENIDKDKKIVIIQCEMGQKEINEKEINENIIIEKIPKGNSLEEMYIKQIVDKYSPDKIIIEQNGMETIEELLNQLDTKSMRKYTIIERIINIIDCKQFNMLMGILGNNLINKISYSDLIILNHVDGVSDDELEDINKKIGSINKSGLVIEINEHEKFLDYTKNKETNKIWKGTIYDKLSILFLIVASIYLSINLLISIDFSKFNIDFSNIYILNTIFISILMESFPFLILGVFISSIIQIFVTRDMIVKYFPKNKIISFLVAIVGGLFFPVCDCAIVPVVSRLVKKGVPLYAAVTFMLAAPIVNPIVIVSTYYAFPGQPQIMIFRLIIGIIVAIITGILFLIFPEEEMTVKSHELDNLCNCIYCNNINNGDIKGKISTIFKHAGEEFFDVGKFLIIGALLTSFFQVIIPKDIILKLGGDSVTAILLMMSIGFLFSLCSSSDAFIARSFLNQFSLSSIMGFMILGPMIDIKNLIMLSDIFSKRFIIKLTFIVFNVTFSAICFFTILYLG
ncbi:permease [Tissierella carlieri]|uniref:permease n=1 Tax=Tissierella carlieri TaxID=689904 RepID=UPI001C0F5C75|nr:permease [Tissierella carlieri]MBU5311836.1 permease [Tissierella carlieri]